MDCLNTNQLALYLTTYGLSAKERRVYEQHLTVCAACRERMNRLQRRLREMDGENAEACANMREGLEAYALGELPEAKREQVLQHTTECHACNALLGRLGNFPALQETTAWEIPVPAQLDKNIATALQKHFGPSPPEVEDKWREIAAGVKDLIHEIQLVLAPLEPAWGFRGEGEVAKSEFVDVQHAGGDLVVNVNIPGVIVELYSSREKYLDDAESDAQGRVTFADMKPDLYKLKVQGHKIEKVGQKI